MWFIIGLAFTALLGFILRPFSSLLALAKFTAFAVAAVSGFCLYMGGPASLYAGPCIIDAVSWIALHFVPIPRRG